MGVRVARRNRHHRRSHSAQPVGPNPLASPDNAGVRPGDAGDVWCEELAAPVVPRECLRFLWGGVCPTPVSVLGKESDPSGLCELVNNFGAGEPALFLVSSYAVQLLRRVLLGHDWVGTGFFVDLPSLLHLRRSK